MHCYYCLPLGGRQKLPFRSGHFGWVWGERCIHQTHIYIFVKTGMDLNFVVKKKAVAQMHLL